MNGYHPPQIISSITSDTSEPPRPILPTADVESASLLLSYSLQLWCIFKVPGETLPDRICAGLRPHRPVTCTDDVWKLLNKCWKPNAEHRPTFDATLRAIKACRGNLNHHTRSHRRTTRATTDPLSPSSPVSLSPPRLHQALAPPLLEGEQVHEYVDFNLARPAKGSIVDGIPVDTSSLGNGITGSNAIDGSNSNATQLTTPALAQTPPRAPTPPNVHLQVSWQPDKPPAAAHNDDETLLTLLTGAANPGKFKSISRTLVESIKFLKNRNLGSSSTAKVAPADAPAAAASGTPSTPSGTAAAPTHKLTGGLHAPLATGLLTQSPPPLSLLLEHNELAHGGGGHGGAEHVQESLEVEVRGMCGYCLKPVLVTQERGKDPASGCYYHAGCGVKKFPSVIYND